MALEVESAAICKAQRAVSNLMIKDDLAFISANYGFLPVAIKQVQISSASLSDQVAIIEGASAQIHAVRGPTAKEVAAKFDDVFGKNDGFLAAKALAKVLNGQQKSEEDTNRISEFSAHQIALFKYCPLHTVELERDFGRYKRILSNTRESFTTAHLRELVIVNCNASIK